MKKLLWRAFRGTVYAAVSSYLASYAQKYGIDPTTVTGIGTGLLLALDKLFGVGAIVKDPAGVAVSLDPRSRPPK